MSKRQLEDDDFHQARRNVDGEHMGDAKVALAFSLVREATLALLVQGQKTDEEAIIQFAMAIAGGELMRDAYLDKHIKYFANRLAKGPIQAGPNP